MGNFAENLNLGNRFRPPLHFRGDSQLPSSNTHWQTMCNAVNLNLGFTPLLHAP